MSKTIFSTQLDSSTAQYMLRMMVLQHMFYQTEYRGMDAKWTLMSPGYEKLYVCVVCLSVCRSSCLFVTVFLSSQYCT